MRGLHHTEGAWHQRAADRCAGHCHRGRTRACRPGHQCLVPGRGEHPLHVFLPVEGQGSAGDAHRREQQGPGGDSRERYGPAERG